MRELAPGQNPRKALTTHRERGRKRWDFTFDDIAAAALCSPRSAEVVNARDLGAVATFIGTRRAAASRRLSVEEVDELMVGARATAWANRWPMLELWWCGVAGCNRVQLFRGLCNTHSGFAPGPQFVVPSTCEGPIVVRFGGQYVKLSRLITGSVDKAGVQVIHRDGNVWNNKIENLVVLSREEQRRLMRQAMQQVRQGAGT